MTWDVREESMGSYSAFKEKQDIAGRDQSYAPMCPVDTQGMKWMKERQRSYRDVQLEFWLLLRPLTDGGEESTRQLACRLLSVWHWSSAVDPPTYPPVPTSMNIGHWLRESDDEDERQLWIEAYACALQCVAEASVGRRWISYKGIRVPKISQSGWNIPTRHWNTSATQHYPSMLATWRDEMPLQNLEGIRRDIIHKLDEVATRIIHRPSRGTHSHSLKWIRTIGEKKLCATIPGKRWTSERACLASDLCFQDNKGEYPTLAAPSFSKDLCWSTTLNETLHNGCLYEEHLPPWQCQSCMQQMTWIIWCLRLLASYRGEAAIHRNPEMHTGRCRERYQQLGSRLRRWMG